MYFSKNSFLFPGRYFTNLFSRSPVEIYEFHIELSSNSQKDCLMR